MNKFKHHVCLLLVCSILGYAPLVASAATKTAPPKTVQPRVDTVENIRKRADQEIDRRTEALNKMMTRIQSMKRVSDAIKEMLTERAKGHITELANLKAKIDAETDMTALKAYAKSITESYRIFMLILPQIAIDAAADRIKTVSDTMTALSAKLQSRLDIAKAAGKDVSSLQSLLDDMNSKVKDAEGKADGAITGISSLAPDNGDKAKIAENKKALEDARAKIKTAVQDLKTARKDAGEILSALKDFGFKYENKNAATTSVEEQTSDQ